MSNTKLYDGKFNPNTMVVFLCPGTLGMGHEKDNFIYTMKPGNINQYIGASELTPVAARLRGQESASGYLVRLSHVTNMPIERLKDGSLETGEAKHSNGYVVNKYPVSKELWGIYNSSIRIQAEDVIISDREATLGRAAEVTVAAWLKSLPNIEKAVLIDEKEQQLAGIDIIATTTSGVEIPVQVKNDTRASKTGNLYWQARERRVPLVKQYKQLKGVLKVKNRGAEIEFECDLDHLFDIPRESQRQFDHTLVCALASKTGTAEVKSLWLELLKEWGSGIRYGLSARMEEMRQRTSLIDGAYNIDLSIMYIESNPSDLVVNSIGTIREVK